MFPPQICPSVEEVIVRLESHLQAMNGTALQKELHISAYKSHANNYSTLQIDHSVLKCFLFYSVSFDVDQVLTLDLPLTDAPVINASSLNLGFKVKIKCR